MADECGTHGSEFPGESSRLHEILSQMTGPGPWQRGRMHGAKHAETDPHQCLNPAPANDTCQPALQVL